MFLAACSDGGEPSTSSGSNDGTQCIVKSNSTDHAGCCGELNQPKKCSVEEMDDGYLYDLSDFLICDDNTSSKSCTKDFNFIEQVEAWQLVKDTWLVGCSNGTTCHSTDNTDRVPLVTIEQLRGSASAIKSQVNILNTMPKNGWNNAQEQSDITDFINNFL